MRSKLVLLLTVMLVPFLNGSTGCSGKPSAAQPTTADTVSKSLEEAGSPNLDSAETVRFATYNVSLYRKRAGALIEDLVGGKNDQAHKLASVVQQVRPDVLLLNEFDYDVSGAAAELFCELYLHVDHNDAKGLNYPYRFYAESNTGVPSGMDLDDNGQTDEPADCFGFGVYPGQYGMLVLSKYPIDTTHVRTFQKFLWSKMPNANLPVDPATQTPYYSDAELSAFRLSSKSHWDVPIVIGSEKIHFLVCHPTPPVFDGPEDRNGRRNHDEIRLFADYIDPARSDYIVDDQGHARGLQAGARFVVAGDLNADPHDGDSYDGAARQLLDHPLVQSSPIPDSVGAAEVGQSEANATHLGDPANDTADFDDRRSGNLRIDYVLPSRTLTPVKAGVFWPPLESQLHQLIKATDHRLVWIDVIP